MHANLYKAVCLVPYMSSSDIENTASEVSMHVDDLLYEVRAMREALEMLQQAAEEGLDQLPDV
tara:strand:+ start:337 stop:525 length:189 start_codon:yes stop_codon:yes gene_type:complete